jgi:hypothetical protein
VEPKYQMLEFVAFMALVFGIAALVLWGVDRRTLPRTLSSEDRKWAIDQRTSRWRGRWIKAQLTMAMLSILLNAVGLFTKSLVARAVMIGLALIFVVTRYNFFDSNG